MSFDAFTSVPYQVSREDNGGGSRRRRWWCGVGANLVVVAVVVLGTNVGILVGLRTNLLSSVHKTAKVEAK
jgi:hypothetical protein